MLVTSLTLLLLAPKIAGAATSRESALLKIICPSTISQGGPSLTFSCSAENRSSQDLLLVASPLILEGPLPPESEYIYFFVGGDRVENVLQYQRGRKPDLYDPILLKPVIHLRLADFSRFSKIRPHTSRQFSVEWTLKPAELPDQGDWSARIKLVYFTKAAVDRLLQQGRLPPVCWNALRRGIARADAQFPLVLSAIRAKEPRGSYRDGCRNAVSEASVHAYSNTFLIRLDPKSGPARRSR